MREGRVFPSFACFNRLAWMLLAQLFFAGMNINTRLGASTLPWPEIAGSRFLIGALMALGLAWYRGSSLRITDQPNTWRRSVYGTIAAACTFYALTSSRIALGGAATLGATAPIFVALLSGPLLAERVDRRVALAVAVGFAGILAVVRPALAIAVPLALVATTGAVFYALAMIWLRKISPSWPWSLCSCWHCPSGAGPTGKRVSSCWELGSAAVEARSR